MEKETKGQVHLYKLIFTANWEDPESDHLALDIKPGDTVMSITSGGCNTLGFLLKDPGQVYTVDINPCQSYLLELKIVSIKHLEYDEFVRFCGLKESEHRLETYRKLREKLGEGARTFWDQQENILNKGFLLNGKYETFVKLVSRFIRLIQGNYRVDHLFYPKNMEEQRIFYEKYWNTRRTRFIFNLFFNKHILARRGLKANYFHFDDGSNTFAQSFFKRFSRVLRDLPVTGNYFLHLYLKGKYRSVEEVPDYLLEKNFFLLKSRVDRIKIITGDAKKWLEEMPSDSFDCVSMSNICELMNLEDTAEQFSEVYRTAKSGAGICFRNLILPREVPENMRDKIVIDEELSQHIFYHDRSFVYGKVAAYKVVK